MSASTPARRVVWLSTTSSSGWLNTGPPSLPTRRARCCSTATASRCGSRTDGHRPASPGNAMNGWLRPLGDTGLVVSAVGAGGGPLGSVPDDSGREVGADEGVATVRRVLAGPITFLDTSNAYSGGKS